MEREKCPTEPLLPDTFAKEPGIRVKSSWTLLTASAYQLNPVERLLLGVVWNRRIIQLNPGLIYTTQTEPQFLSYTAARYNKIVVL